jgi:formylglycine-generating enzyme required for sulfatase activity
VADLTAERERRLGLQPGSAQSSEQSYAFCQWLSRHERTSVSLPTVWQWIGAARSSKGTDGFPWGDEFDRMRCNSRQSDVGATTAVGIFTEGASYYGLFDCGGNVWEFSRLSTQSWRHRALQRRQVARRPSHALQI